MPRAFLALRHDIPRRTAAFRAGLEASGYEVIDANTTLKPEPCDVAIGWNRMNFSARVADQMEAAGGRVIVVENGYCGADADGDQYLALALHQHGGAGEWKPIADPSRWEALGITLKPWRAHGRHILICMSRGFGPAKTRMPIDWPTEMRDRLRAKTDREIILRRHPGIDPDYKGPSLDEQLAGAHAVFVWGSNAGTRALIEGVPVYALLPRWIMQPACVPGLGDIERPQLPDRVPAFIRMSWAQWTLAEIATGFPFERLLK